MAEENHWEFQIVLRRLTEITNEIKLYFSSSDLFSLLICLFIQQISNDWHLDIVAIKTDSIPALGNLHSVVGKRSQM